MLKKSELLLYSGLFIGSWMAASDVLAQQPADVANTLGGSLVNGTPTVEIKGFLLDGGSIPFGASSGGISIGSSWSAPKVAPSLTNSPSDDCAASPKTNLPVVIATGEKVQKEFDFFDASLAGLSMDRTYRSVPSERYGRMFGPRWFSTFDFPFLEYSKNCTVYQFRASFGCLYDWINVGQPDGKTYQYAFHTFPVYFPSGFGGGDSAAGYLQIFATDDYRVFIGQRVYQYNRASRNLMSIDENGARLYTFVYDQYQQLTSVTARNGKSIIFTWNAGRVTSIKDSSDQVWTYEYDANRNLVKVVPPVGVAGGVREYHYEDPADPQLLTGITVDGVRKTRYSYENGRVKRSGFENNEEFQEFQYSASPLYTTVTDQRGQVSRYDFEQVKNFKRNTKVSRSGSPSCGASASQQTYDANGYVNSSLDWNGNRTTYTYSYGGLKATETTAAGTSAALTKKFHWSGINLATVTWADSQNNDFLQVEYQRMQGGLASSLLTAEIRTDLGAKKLGHPDYERRTDYRYTFHPNGLLETLVASRALPTGPAETTYTYNSDGFLTQIKNPLGHIEQYSEHNGRGQPRVKIDPNGLKTTYVYDNEGKLLSMTEGERLTRFTYNGDRQVTRVDYPDGQATVTLYNSAGRVTDVGNALGEFVSMSLSRNAASNEVSTAASVRKIPSINGTSLSANASGSISKTVESDTLGRPWKVFGNNGQRADYTYDANGNVKSVKDALGRETSYVYDAQNRVQSITAPDGGITTFAYNSEGRLGVVTDPRGIATSYHYNAFGEVTVQISADTGTTYFKYDSGGRLHHRGRPDGKTEGYAWDALDRLVRREVGAEVETYSYDVGSYAKGRLSGMTDASGSSSFTYNQFGQLLSKTSTIGSIPYQTSWSYDSNGRKTGMTYPNGLRLIYSYDNGGRVSGISSIAP